MRKRSVLIGCGVIAIAVILMVLVFVFVGGKKNLRSVKVIELSGLLSIERGGKTIEAKKDMELSSEDIIIVGDDSSARIMLDDDKYLFFGKNSRAKITVEGTAEESKTQVFLESGSLLTEVKEKLSADSYFEILTPNSIMSIRGTKTLTEVIKDVLGKIKTSAAVVEGHVKFQTVQKDKNGKTKFVTNDLSVGQGLAIQTEEKDLVSDADMKRFAENGRSNDINRDDETTHEELGSDLSKATFTDDFMNSAAEVLGRSAEEDRIEAENNENTNGTGKTVKPEGSAIMVLNDIKDNGAKEPDDVHLYVEAPKTDADQDDDDEDDEDGEDGETEEERVAREEHERLEKEEAERLEREEQEKKEREEREAAEREEAERLEREMAAREEAELLAREMAKREEAKESNPDNSAGSSDYPVSGGGSGSGSGSEQNQQQTFKITFFTERSNVGEIIFPVAAAGDIISYGRESSGNLYMVAKAGSTIKLPEVENLSGPSDHAYVSMSESAGSKTRLYCYGTGADIDVAALALTGATQSTAQDESSDLAIYYPGQTITLNGNLNLEMYFISPVEVRVIEPYSHRADQRINVKCKHGDGSMLFYTPSDIIYNSEALRFRRIGQDEDSYIGKLPGAGQGADVYTWIMNVNENNNSDKIYTFSTVYYGKAFTVPDIGTATGESQDITTSPLCYTLANGQAQSFDSGNPIAFAEGQSLLSESNQDGEYIITIQYVD